MTAFTAKAHPNIALVKYWGKADEAQMLPSTGSISLTLDAFPTTTTVELSAEATDRFQLNGGEASDAQRERVVRFLDLVRERAGSTAHAVVTSRNAGPTGAGLASSASGFAALAVAASAAYGLSADTADLSRLARRGSGSATRSLIPGMSIWHAGSDASSFAEPIAAPPLATVIVFVDEAHKAVSSREAMRRTALTSPFHAAWITSTEQSLAAMRSACEAGDFTRIGRIAESNALRMHAVIQSADPPIRYLTAASIAVFDAVVALRASGIEAYATADAGANVVVLVRPADADAVAEALQPFGRTVVAGAGPGATLIADEREPR